MANDFSPFVPQWWANETLAILEENMVALGLVHRDFEPMFNMYGDIVNTRRPSEFKAIRKVKTDNITVQDATATNVQVTLDQHIHVSFQVNDLDQRSSMVDLIATYVKPAGLALARAADRVVLGQYPRFLPNTVGKLQGGSAGGGYMLQNLARLKTKLDQQKAYEEGRNLIMTPLTESYYLGDPAAYRVNEAGSNAERVSGSIGRLMGLQTYGAQNMADVLLNPTGVTKSVLASGASLVGSTSVPTDGWASGTDIVAGDWVLINGQPNRVESVAGTYSSGATVMTLTVKYGLANGVADNDTIVAYKPVLVNNASGYASGWNKGIEFDGTGSGYEPQVGEAVQIGSYVYTVIDKPTATSLLLDRSLQETIADNAKIQPLPHGSYNFAFHRNALTVAVRPLAPVPAGTGARSATVNYNDLTVRATMGYDMTSQNMIVTLDFLMGVQVLDTNLGALLLA
jgi:hypothetical protein